jgi:hypothetical protein
MNQPVIEPTAVDHGEAAELFQRVVHQVSAAVVKLGAEHDVAAEEGELAIE